MRMVCRGRSVGLRPRYMGTYNSGTKMKKKECVTDGDDVT